MYSSRYFKEYVEGDYASVAFVFSSDTANKNIKVSWEAYVDQYGL